MQFLDRYANAGLKIKEEKSTLGREHFHFIPCQYRKGSGQFISALFSHSVKRV